MYTFSSRVRYSECNEKGVLSDTALINYLQDCCTFQSEDLDIGLSYLKEHQLGWFITSWDIRILRMPHLGEHIKVNTWPYGFRGFFGSRNFTVEDEHGHVLVEADSLWILMDLEHARPQRLPEKMQKAYVIEEALSSNVKKEKIQPQEDARDVRHFVVDQTYLDSNHHMNNGYYVEAALGEIPEDFAVNRILVEYKKSAVLGDEVICRLSQQADGWQVDLLSTDNEVYAIVEFRGE